MTGSEGDGDQLKEPPCLCGLVRVTHGAIVVSLVEIIVLSHGLIFVVVNYFSGETRYRKFNPVFADVVRYDYLLALLVVQLAWLLANLFVITGVKVSMASLLLPRLLVQPFAVVSTTFLCVVCVAALRSGARANWALSASLGVATAATLAEIYVAKLIVVSFRFLLKQRVAVAAEKLWLQSIPTQRDTDTAYSARSRFQGLTDSAPSNP